MLKAIFVGLHKPISYPMDPNAIFEAGMIAQLKVVGRDVVLGVSDGTAPFGVIDDTKTIAVTRAKIDEVVIIKASNIVYDGYTYTMGSDVLAELEEGPISLDSFVSNYEGIQASAKGNVLAPIGTELNYSVNGSPTPNAVKIKVSYSYYINNTRGVDTTMGPGRIAVWLAPGSIMQTDQFEVDSPYSVNAVLYVSSGGKLTTKKTISGQPGVGMVIVPPSAVNPMLEFVWRG